MKLDLYERENELSESGSAKIAVFLEFVLIV